jgi:hypothetical protein
MAKDPAFLFYPADASEETQFMNRLERGAYFDILKAQKKFGKFSKEQLTKVLGSDFEACWPSLELVLKLEDGFYFIEWVAEKIEERKKFSESRSKNRSKRDTTPPSDEHMLNITPSSVKDMVDVIEDKLYSEKDKVENLEKMIVVEMMNVWEKHKPRYKKEIGLDYTALLGIAYAIGAGMGVEKNKIVSHGSTTNLNELLILEEWDKVVQFICNDDYLDRLTLAGIENKKNWHSLQNKMSYQPKPKKTAPELARINPEDYFER